jgi:RNA polymerase sigma factor (sigma-70 family)
MEEYKSMKDPKKESNKPEEELTEDEYEDLHKALEALSPVQRELLERVFLDGVSQRQIAEEENVSEAAVSQRIKRIRAKMERVLCREFYS